MRKFNYDFFTIKILVYPQNWFFSEKWGPKLNNPHKKKLFETSVKLRNKLSFVEAKSLPLTFLGASL